MFEDMTYEKILKDMLDSVDDSIDKRKNSIIFDALSPIALRHAQMYVDLDKLLKVVFLDTSVDDYLQRKGSYEFNVDINEAVGAVRNATFIGTSPKIGTRFFAEKLFWKVDENGNVVCETTGTIGNSLQVGTSLIPAEYVDGLTSATIGEVVVPGTEIEDNDSYRNRIISKIREPRVNSNKAQIRSWCLSITGIGEANVIPLWNGPNTVKAVLINTQAQTVNSELVKEVQDYIDPIGVDGNHGLGEGVADIGVVFTAVAATPLVVNVSADVDLASGKIIEEAVSEATTVLTQYLKDIVLSDTKKDSYVRYSKVGALMSDLTSVLDFHNLTINGISNNLPVGEDYVAVLGQVNFI